MRSILSRIGARNFPGAIHTTRLLETGSTPYTLKSIDPEDRSRLLVGTNGDGIYRSLDGGASWSRADLDLNNSWVFSAAIDPRDPAVLWAGTATGDDHWCESLLHDMVYSGFSNPCFWSTIGGDDGVTDYQLTDGFRHFQRLFTA